MNRLLHNYFWGLLLSTMLIPIIGNAYNQTYDVKVGETFTVYTTYHSDITAILWTIPYGYVEPVSYIGPAATSVNFRATKEIPSGVIIQAVIYTNYQRAGVDDWLVRITDDGSGGGEGGDDGSGGGEEGDDSPKYGDTFTSNVGGCEMTFYVINPNDKYVLVGDGVSPAIDTETTGSITIPSTINGYTVDGINNSAFPFVVS